ncbi:MAG: RNA polymerase sigma factor [Planctomycetota bacterium]
MQITNWKTIVDEYGKAVWQTVYRLLGEHADAADCFQETFVSALEFSRRKHVKNFAALLTRIATNKAIDCIRKRFRDAKYHANIIRTTDMAGGSPPPEEWLEAHELVAQLRDALAKLSKIEAEVFCLRCFSDFSYRQISRQMSLSNNSVRVLFHRAKKKLPQLLGDEQENQKQGRV